MWTFPPFTFYSPALAGPGVRFIVDIVEFMGLF